MFKKESQTVVFDIGSQNLKFMKGVVRDDAINITDYDLIHLPEPFVEDGSVVDKKGLTRELSRLKRRTGSKDIRLVLSSRHIILRTFALPVMEQDEVREAVKFEMSVLLPEQIDDYIVDGIAMNRYKEDTKEGQENTMVEVLVKDIIDQDRNRNVKKTPWLKF